MCICANITVQCKSVGGLWSQSSEIHPVTPPFSRSLESSPLSLLHWQLEKEHAEVGEGHFNGPGLVANITSSHIILPELAHGALYTWKTAWEIHTYYLYALEKKKQSMVTTAIKNWRKMFSAVLFMKVKDQRNPRYS